ncbi:aminoglycoside phosphotransferase family protein [Companilactobacillus zhongbaensis]|uniref:phosphotransferase n=1 Tax=Companilactobacillus zhongbaensis TaxID=2486009 RepID=UPI000F7A87B6|nr:phosphotransferase [Companilactobacillus zhongbaensis]
MEQQILSKIKEYLKNATINTECNMGEVQKVDFLAQGEYNRNFFISDNLGQNFVFRINYGSQINQAKQARYEFQALNMLFPSGRTPKPLLLDDSKQYFDHDILIEQFLPGRPLIYERDLSQAAEIFGDVHRLTLDDHQISQLITETNICSDRINEAKSLLETVFQSNKVDKDGKKILTTLFNWCNNHVDDQYFSQQPQNIVNTEVNSNNFLITDDYGYLIDWEKPVYSNSVQDLTQFLAKTTTLWRTDTILSQKQVDQFLLYYSRLVERSYEEVKESVISYMPFLLLRALSWCAMLITTYDEKPIQNEEIYLRSKMYLTIDFAKPLLKEYGVNIDG